MVAKTGPLADKIEWDLLAVRPFLACRDADIADWTLNTGWGQKMAFDLYAMKLIKLIESIKQVYSA